jgi:hypothetical protein
MLLRQTSKNFDFTLYAAHVTIIKTSGVCMSVSMEYVKALENLIIFKLLPIYVEHYKDKGIDPPFDKLLISFLAKLGKTSKEVPALLKARR